MAIFYNINDLPTFKNAVLTIGTFDGVHLGHRMILDEVVRHAKEINGESIVLTFEPHPRKLLFPEQSLKLITPLEEKIQLIAAEGIEHIVVAPFNKAFANLSATDYIEHFLVKYFHPESIIIGYDHHFGHDRKGDIHLLKEFQTDYNFKVYEIPAQLIDAAAVSSTKIRHAIMEGNVQEAAHMIGRNYSLKGNVVEGAKLGRTIGFPTANIQPDDNDQLLPAVGVYAVKIEIGNELYKGMLNIGYKPTVTEEKKLAIEVHIFDFDKDIYNETVNIIFVERLRDEQKFPSLDALKTQLNNDKVAAKKILG